MHLEFHGAARTVTGSCFLLKVKDKQILIECGMFQGGKKMEKRNTKPFKFSPKAINYVLLTHGHIDHSGLLPKLVNRGFKGPIITTRATGDLLSILLRDAAHIQETETEWINRKARRAGKRLAKPLYTIEDADAALELVKTIKYEKEVELCDGVKFTFRDAGHILGSAFIEMTVTEKRSTRKIVFSGDVGNTDQAIIRNPDFPESADILLVESTYGNRNHKKRTDTLNELHQILLQAYDEGGNVVIPAFAVGRTQEILYQLRQLHQEGRFPAFNVFIDSPMAISATDIYREHTECFDAETIQILMSGEGPFSLPNVHYTRQTDQSKAINFTEGPNLIISASGMCDAGRILHHLKHNLWKPNSHIVFVGYQAEGSLGRRIIEGIPKVKIYGEEIAVVARVHTIGGFSAHADQTMLTHWVEHMAAAKPKVYVVHGEEKAGTIFAEKLKSDLGLDATLPMRHEVVHL